MTDVDRKDSREMDNPRQSQEFFSKGSYEEERREGALPTTETHTTPAPRGPQLHPAFYIAVWTFFSNSTILFNKWILDTQGFRFPAILTTMHLAFSVIMTQILARTTPSLLNPRAVRMTGRIYLRNIVPIGILYSFSLVCSNLVYLYLSVAYIQMLKSAAPVVMLLVSWAFRTQHPSMKKFLNVIVITVGVAIASVGELQFSFIGFMFQVVGIVFETLRIVLIEILVSGKRDGSGGSGLQKMDPLLTLYYYAPVCMVTNFMVALATEWSSFSLADLNRIGPFMLFTSAVVAFLLNVSSIFLIGRTSGVVLTLSGIFKNVLLVFTSMAMWGTAITSLQWLGYLVAIMGLLYYSLGADALGNIVKKLQLQDNALVRMVGNPGFFTKVKTMWNIEEDVLSSNSQRNLNFVVAAAFMLMVLMGLMYGPNETTGTPAGMDHSAAQVPAQDNNGTTFL